MSGSNSRWLLALAGAIVLATGVALATPVRVLDFSDATHEVLAPLDDGEAVTYSYRQSIYDVPVYEDFVRRGNVIELERVRSPDVRSIEYFHWDVRIARDPEGLWYADAPPPTAHDALVLRIAPLGQQRWTTARWTVDLLPRFGEAVVTVRVQERPRIVALLEAPR